MSGTRCQWSPGPAVQPGLRSTRSGRRSSAAAATASSVIRVANGWVASTTASVSWSRSHRVSPGAAEAADPHVALRQQRHGDRARE